ncbi:PREDICTED: uncharacterized protein LOC102823040 [Chrysochloris asiatica]|uniref:Uncharacterized protein LOC102823040 n=1 Tax=Chrysochloris asiatica TaxID=185453 RepID=A0A9B0TDU9_CHRAS|nr:PREDICTED: uncharacterized protein LOC102823040 [Chrysochloris asiatica]
MWEYVLGGAGRSERTLLSLENQMPPLVPPTPGPPVNSSLALKTCPLPWTDLENAAGLLRAHLVPKLSQHRGLLRLWAKPLQFPVPRLSVPDANLGLARLLCASSARPGASWGQGGERGPDEARRGSGEDAGGLGGYVHLVTPNGRRPRRRHGPEAEGRGLAVPLWTRTPPYPYPPLTAVDPNSPPRPLRALADPQPTPTGPSKPAGDPRPSSQDPEDTVDPHLLLLIPTRSGSLPTPPADSSEPQWPPTPHPRSHRTCGGSPFDPSTCAPTIPPRPPGGTLVTPCPPSAPSASPCQAAQTPCRGAGGTGSTSTSSPLRVLGPALGCGQGHAEVSVTAGQGLSVREDKDCQGHRRLGSIYGPRQGPREPASEVQMSSLLGLEMDDRKPKGPPGKETEGLSPSEHGHPSTQGGPSAAWGQPRVQSGTQHGLQTQDWVSEQPLLRCPGRRWNISIDERRRLALLDNLERPGAGTHSCYGEIAQVVCQLVSEDVDRDVLIPHPSRSAKSAKAFHAFLSRNTGSTRAEQSTREVRASKPPRP